MANVLNGEETLPKLLIAWVGCTNVITDRRQTDGRAMTYSEREREFIFANYGKFFTILIQTTKHKT